MFLRLPYLLLVFLFTQSFAGVLRLEKSDNKLSVFRENGSEPILVENVREGHRPYIHPIVAPDGNGILTEYRTSHYLHQTEIYWGFTRVNGRNYFIKPSDDRWQLLEVNIVSAAGEVVQWETIYHLLDEDGTALMEETQVWSMQDTGEELYDLKNDPEQLNNLAGNAKYNTIQNTMRRKLFNHLAEAQDPRVVGGVVDWDYYPYYGRVSTKEWKVDKKPE